MNALMKWLNVVSMPNKTIRRQWGEIEYVKVMTPDTITLLSVIDEGYRYPSFTTKAMQGL